VASCSGEHYRLSDKLFVNTEGSFQLKDNINTFSLIYSTLKIILIPRENSSSSPYMKTRILTR
jgi:hypothetical protein